MSVCHVPWAIGDATTYKEFHFRNFLVDLFHELNDEIDQLMLEHFFGMRVGDQKRDVIALLLLLSGENCESREPLMHTLTGFRRRIKKDSAR